MKKTARTFALALVASLFVACSGGDADPNDSPQTSMGGSGASGGSAGAGGAAAGGSGGVAGAGGATVTGGAAGADAGGARADAEAGTPDADAAKGDADAQTDAEAGLCGAGMHSGYLAPGCGAGAVLACLHDVWDACAGIYCGCDGVTYFGGCEGSNRPFASRGACADASPDGGDAQETGAGACQASLEVVRAMDGIVCPDTYAEAIDLAAQCGNTDGSPPLGGSYCAAARTVLLRGPYGMSFKKCGYAGDGGSTLVTASLHAAGSSYCGGTSSVISSPPVGDTQPTDALLECFCGFVTCPNFLPIACVPRDAAAE